MIAYRIAVAPAPIVPDTTDKTDKTLGLTSAYALGIPALIAAHFPLRELIGGVL